MGTTLGLILLIAKCVIGYLLISELFKILNRFRKVRYVYSNDNWIYDGRLYHCKYLSKEITDEEKSEKREYITLIGKGVNAQSKNSNIFLNKGSDDNDVVINYDIVVFQLKKNSITLCRYLSTIDDNNLRVFYLDGSGVEIKEVWDLSDITILGRL